MKTQQIFFEKLTAKRLRELAGTFSAKRILLVHGNRSFDACGAGALFSKAFKTGFCVEHFSAFTENPKWEDVKIGVEIAEKFQPDLIFGIGGGSPMDAAKLIRFFLAYSGVPAKKTHILRERVLPLIAIPTTAGTGAESTRFAVCYQNDVKCSVSHANVLPDIAVVDWRFSQTQSDYTTACAGFDALAQAIESYWSKKSTKRSRELAAEAIKLIFPILLLRERYQTPDFRERMARGANLAGQSINITTTTVCHAFSYKITSLLGLPHGHAVAVSLPFFFEFARSRGDVDLQKKMSELSQLLNGGNELVDYVRSVFHGLFVPVIPTNSAWQTIQKSVNPERLSNFPLPVLISQIKKSDFIWE